MANNADGQILINSKIDVAGIKKGTKEIGEYMRNTGETANKAANRIESAFKDVDTKKAFEALPKEAKAAYAQIETIRADDLSDNQKKADEIAMIFGELGQEQTAAQKNAWAIIEATTDEGSREIINDLERIATQANDTGDEVKGISSTFTDMFKANLSAEALISGLKSIASACINLGKQAVEAAANTAASTAQFEQTFEGVESTAKKALQGISDETGISTKRMQESFTKIFAFTKSVGGETDEAMNISERALRAAADSAAYYDRSIEDATETLQSFLKGNYENDAALGIAATETTRNAKANELYAKSFSDLSEAQKVDTLLAMVEAGNEASGAIGQAAREADQWTNVTGELQDAWTQVLAKFGSPILSTLTPIIQGITKGMRELTEVSAAESLIDTFDDMADSLVAADEAFELTSQQIEDNANLAAVYKNSLAELASEVSTSKAAAQEYATVVELLSELYPDLNLSIDAQTGLLDEASQKRLEYIDTLIAEQKQQAHNERYLVYLREREKATAELKSAQKELNRVEEQQIATSKQLMEITGSSADELLLMMSNGQVLWEQYSEEQANEVVRLIELYQQLEQQRVELDNAVSDSSAALEEQEATVNGLAEAYNVAKDAASGVADSQQDIAVATEQVTEKVKEFEEEFEDAYDTAKSSLNSTMGLFDKYEKKSSMTTSQMVANWKNQKEALDGYRDNLQSLVDAGLSQKLVQQLSDGSAESIAAVQELANATPDEIDKINDAFEDLDKSKETTAGLMADISLDMSNTLATMERNNAQQWGEMADEVGEAIDRMQRYINNLKGRTMLVEMVTRYTSTGMSTTTAGGNGSISPYSMRDQLPVAAYDVPMLAKGTVIPPNAPFMAILGDQKNGTNVEAPLSTIQDAVANIMNERGNSQNININFTGDLAELARILQPAIEYEGKRRGENLAVGSDI